MPVELMVLGWAAVLAFVQLGLFAVPANMELGPSYTAGPRDERREDALSPLCGRLRRAFLNHIENLVLFTVAVVVVLGANASSGVTETAAVVYLVARVAYVPAYVSGIPYLRSAIFAVGWIATLAMLLVALLF